MVFLNSRKRGLSLLLRGASAMWRGTILKLGTGWERDRLRLIPPATRIDRGRVRRGGLAGGWRWRHWLDGSVPTLSAIMRVTCHVTGARADSLI